MREVVQIMRVLIWGTGKLVKRYMQYEYFVNCEIIGFVDSNKKDDLFMGYNVYEPSEIALLDYEYLVVCVLKSNREILQTCIEEEIDLRKIFFVSGETNYEGELSRFSGQLLNKDEVKSIFPIICKDIEERQERDEFFKSFDENKELTEGAVIYQLDDQHVVVWIPIELLFSQRTEDNIIDDYTDEWKLHSEKWADLPIIMFEPHKCLYAFFQYGSEYPDTYCNWYQKIYTSRELVYKYTDESLIDKRFREFKSMQRKLNKGMDFFIEHPAIAKWNPKGYFNLLDGHHRTMFLYSSGLTRIPVQITKKDYDMWCNKKMAVSVHEIIKKQKRKEFYQPILNPYYMDINSYREGYAKSRLHYIMEYFGSQRLIGKKVIDVGANLGYMGQAFARMGCDVTLLEPDPLHYELMQKINDLLYIKCNTVMVKFEDYETTEKFDIAILLTVFYHYYSDEAIKVKFVQHLNKMVSQMIIWESGGSSDEEKKYIIEHTKFTNYQRLCYTYATGKFRELGIFWTNESQH